MIKGAKKLGNITIKGKKWEGKKVEEVYKFTEKTLDNTVQPIYNILEKTKVKLIEWLQKNPVMKKLYDFAKCFFNNNAINGNKTIFDAISSIVELIPKLSIPAGWIEFLVKIVCGWESLKKSIEFLIKANKETDRLKKYHLYGKFMGRLVEAAIV